MFLGIEGYWWLIVIIIAVLSIPLKVKLMKRWNERRKNKETGKWGDDE